MLLFVIPAAPHPGPLPACGEREAIGARVPDGVRQNIPSPRTRGEGWGEGNL